MLETLGIQNSFSRPRVSNDNPYSESLFRTLKYRPGFPHKGFVSLEEARNWAKGFVNWYNEVHLHSGLNFVTPVQCHNGAYRDILEQRNMVYEQAKQEHPERWGNRSTRDWSPHEQVALNPMRDEMRSVSINQ